jgi:uncharacterized metal-binding protein YceD (DUF177 family)
MKADRAPTALECVRTERVDDLADGEERAVALVADESERRALARRFGLVAIESLAAAGSLRRFGELVRADLVLRAAVVQTCVVSLAPVAAAIEEPLVLSFAPEVPASGPEVDLDAEADDPPGPITHGSIEFGEAVAEALGLALDPYPRAPGVAFEGWPAAAEPLAEAAPDTPFAVLARLRK